MNTSDVLIIGAGAAGLMCALEAGKRGRSVIILEKADKPGKKIRISGGGRCNFTNLHTSPEHFISENPHFCKSALARYRPADFIDLLKSHYIPFHERLHGQLFCDESAGRIIEMFESELKKQDAKIIVNAEIQEVKKGEAGFNILTGQGNFFCDSLVIATGGPSIPKMGATNYGVHLAERFGLNVVPLMPALVPLTWSDKEKDDFSELSGISIDGEVSCNARNFREKVLFTHRGLSGPAILQISSYWNPGDSIYINLLPDMDFQELLMKYRSKKQKVENFLSQYLPKRLSRIFCLYFGFSGWINEYSEQELKKLAGTIHRWEIKPNGTEGYRTAEVTRGGVDTNELSSRTMESKKIPGLYFIGEVVDVTGHLGGFNFLWAWASGFAAGQYV